MNLFLEISEFLYPCTRFSILEEMSVPVILGREFMANHSQVMLEYGGPLGPLKIPSGDLLDRELLNKDVNSYSGCFVAAIKKEAPSPFASMHAETTPIACPSRRYKPEDRAFIKEEILRLLETGVVEPCQSPWRAQVVVVKNRKKRRMVIDYSQTVNRYTYLDAFPFPVMDELAQQMSNYKYFSTYDLKDAYHQVPLRVEDRDYTAFEADGRLFRFTRLPFWRYEWCLCFPTNCR